MELSRVAYTKIMMHCLKHNSSDTIGLLIKNEDKIIDVIPLFHESVMGPTLDAAFHLIQDFYLASNPSYKIAGVYESSISAKENKFLPSVYRILDVFKENSQRHLIALKLVASSDEDASTHDELDLQWYNYEGDSKIDRTDDIV